MAVTRQAKRGPRVVEVPTAQVRLQAPGHLADWPRRAEVVPAFAARVAHLRKVGRWVDAPLRLRKQRDGYLLVTGFARLAIAVEAGLPTVQAVVEPRGRTLPLDQIHLRPWQEKARLNPQKLAQRREQARQRGGLPAALEVRPAEQDETPGYTLLDGLYGYRIAQELGWSEVPVVVRVRRAERRDLRAENRAISSMKLSPVWRTLRSPSTEICR